MGKAMLAMALPALLAACDSRAASAPASAQEMKAREFTRAMKTIDGAYENLQVDLAAGKKPDEVRAHLATIRTASEQAAKLDYRKSEAENRDLAFEFRKFIDASGKLEGVKWSGDEGLKAWRQLGTACASCHDLYRKDPDR
jgi:cytochrome c556